MPDFDNRGVRGRGYVVVAALFLILTVVATWPLALHLDTHVPGDPNDPGDYWAYYWDLWWVKEALLSQQSPLHTSLLYRPDGADLYFHSLMIAPSTLMVPITALLGPTISYNFLVWLSFVGSAFGVYLLALRVLGPLGSRRAAFLGGVVYAFSAYRFSRMMGHLDLLSTQWLPFVALFLLRSAREGGWANACALAVFTVLTGLTNWYLTLSLVLLVCTFLFERLFSGGWAAAARMLGRIAPSLLLAAAMTSPAWLGIFREGGQGGQLGDPLGDNLANSADLLGFVLPSSAHPLWGHAIDSVRMALFGPNDNVVENTVFLGFVPLTLAFVGWREARSAEARPFRWVWIVFIVLSIGPCLRVLGHTVRIGEWAVPMPYLLLYHLPYGTLAHAPVRFVLVGGIGLAVLAALGAQRVLVRRGPLAASLLAAAGCLALFETAAVPYPLAAVRIPAVYDHLTGPASGVVLEAPIPDWPAQLPQRMLYQTRHGHPVFGGYLSRSLPPQPFETLPGFREIKKLSLDGSDIDHIGRPILPAVARVVLRAYGTTDVVLLKNDFQYLPGLNDAGAQARIVLTSLLGAPIYEDDEAAVFSVADTEAPAFACPERGFLPVEGGLANPERVLLSRGRIGLWAPRDGRYEIGLTGHALGNSRGVELRFNDGVVGAMPFEAGPSQARYSREMKRGWQLVELTCRMSAAPHPSLEKDAPCLALSGIALTEGPG
ncbi:MAG: hypothetical protein KA385_10045 [Vicinamibacteria bacterium]|nr:hypothetical protein [Vicinamibacteria bacterium]